MSPCSKMWTLNPPDKLSLCMYVSRRPWAVAILDAVWEDLRRPLGESLYYDVLMVQVRASLPLPLSPHTVCSQCTRH